GGITGKYIGVFQIDENLHKNTALSLGFDIYTVDGNLGYAKYLYTMQGATPWKNCSNNYYKTVGTMGNLESQKTITNLTLTKNLSLGMTDAEVYYLQKLLNETSYSVATEGAGSKGKETNYFGTLTQTALQKFQC